MKKNKDAFIKVIYIISVIVAIIGIYKVVIYCTWSEKQTYYLQEIEDEVYAVNYSTVSKAPAYNYQIVKICFNDRIVEFRGNVNIQFTVEKPYAVVTYTHVSNGDTIDIYVPKDSVKIDGSVRIN